MHKSTDTTKQASELRVEKWIDGEGRPRQGLSLVELGSRFKMIYCFQHWCPGCHSVGFPVLKELTETFAARDVTLGVAVVQTVFEGAETNTFERLRETQLRYGLAVPFGHDETENGVPTVMQDYRTGGTPWFILIDPSGRIVHSHFRIDVDQAIALASKHKAPGA